MKPILAPAKVNLCLFLGPTRSEDGRHELVTVLDALTLADLLVLEPGLGADEVICPGVSGPNLVSGALAALREAGWDAPALRVSIEKRIPVAAGMGGGSSDAAAILAHAREEGAAIDVAAVARGLGADVSALIDPGLWLAGGVGDTGLVALSRAAATPRAYVVVPSPLGLSTPEVYREADRLGLPRSMELLADLRARLQRDLAAGRAPEAGLIVNDLQPAAISLMPSIGTALAALEAAGADRAIVSGSGPTAVGIWWGEGCVVAAERAAIALCDRFPGTQSALPYAHSSQFGPS